MMKNMFIKSLLLSSLALSLNADFIRDNTKLVVTDTETGLMWQDDAVGTTRPLASAITICENLTLGGYSGWRLPNIRELKSIVNRTKEKPALPSAFTSFASGYYWSSTINESVWVVDFNYGGDAMYGKAGSNNVRCVRTGQ